MEAPVIIKQYPKGINGALTRKMAEAGLFRKGYFVYSEEEVKQYSGGKGCALALIFLPLALLGGKKYIKVIYHLQTAEQGQ
jgi:hypothetical protein